MWRRDLPARSLEDLEARLDYWTALGGEDGTGYAVVLDDVRRLPKTVIPPVADLGETTSDRARRLKGEHPDWSLAQIGKALGISRQAVHKHLRRHLSD